MKTLLILRHAKSSWDDPNLPDHDRPLTARGKGDAVQIGRLLREHDLAPDLIVSSTAKRARKTAAKVAKACGHPEEIETTSRLYEAAARHIIEVLREIDDRHAIVLIVGHNPGLQELVHHQTGQPEPMPTAALAQVTLDIDSWRDLGAPSAGRLIRIWRPKEL